MGLTLLAGECEKNNLVQEHGDLPQSRQKHLHWRGAEDNALVPIALHDFIVIVLIERPLVEEITYYNFNNHSRFVYSH